MKRELKVIADTSVVFRVFSASHTIPMKRELKVVMAEDTEEPRARLHTPSR